ADLEQKDCRWPKEPKDRRAAEIGGPYPRKPQQVDEQAYVGRHGEKDADDLRRENDFNTPNKDGRKPRLMRPAPVRTTSQTTRFQEVIRRLASEPKALTE